MKILPDNHITVLFYSDFSEFGLSDAHNVLNGIHQCFLEKWRVVLQIFSMTHWQFRTFFRENQNKT